MKKASLRDRLLEEAGSRLVSRGGRKIERGRGAVNGAAFGVVARRVVERGEKNQPTFREIQGELRERIRQHSPLQMVFPFLG